MDNEEPTENAAVISSHSKDNSYETINKTPLHENLMTAKSNSECIKEDFSTSSFAPNDVKETKGFSTDEFMHRFVETILFSGAGHCEKLEMKEQQFVALRSFLLDDKYESSISSSDESDISSESVSINNSDGNTMNIRKKSSNGTLNKRKSLVKRTARNLQYVEKLHLGKGGLKNFTKSSSKQGGENQTKSFIDGLTCKLATESHEEFYEQNSSIFQSSSSKNSVAIPSTSFAEDNNGYLHCISSHSEGNDEVNDDLINALPDETGNSLSYYRLKYNFARLSLTDSHNEDSEKENKTPDDSDFSNTDVRRSTLRQRPGRRKAFHSLCTKINGSEALRVKETDERLERSREPIQAMKKARTEENVTQWELTTMKKSLSCERLESDRKVLKRHLSENEIYILEKSEAKQAAKRTKRSNATENTEEEQSESFKKDTLSE